MTLFQPLLLNQSQDNVINEKIEHPPKTPFGKRLHVESAFIVKYAKTVHESTLLLETSMLGEQWDRLRSRWMDVLNQHYIIRKCLATVGTVSIPLHHVSIPTLARRDFSSSMPTLGIYLLIN